MVGNLLEPQDGKFITILPVGDSAKEFEQLIQSSDTCLSIDTIIRVHDNPTSKTIRNIYFCSISAENDAEMEGSRNSSEYDFAVYAKSFKEAPAVHREYSDAYKHLLYTQCRHIPDS